MRIGIDWIEFTVRGDSRAKCPFKKASEENYSGASKPSLSKATAPRFQE
jgi:hypothetical protein